MMMRTASFRAYVGCVVVSLTSLAGCTATSPAATTTATATASHESRDAARSRVTQVMDEISSLLSVRPISSEKTASGSELSCGSNLTQWSTGLTIEYARMIDVPGLFDSVRVAFSDDDVWKVRESTTRRGAPRLSVRWAGGENYILSEWSDKQIDVVAFSPCYPTPDA
jgi:hypothetical protein